MAKEKDLFEKVLDEVGLTESDLERLEKELDKYLEEE